MKFFWAFRLLVLSVVLILSIPVIGLSAYYLVKHSVFNIPGWIEFPFPVWDALALAAGGISLIILLPMFVYDVLRRGAVLAWVAFDLLVLLIIAGVFIAAGADNISVMSDLLSQVSNFENSLIDAPTIPATCEGLKVFAVLLTRIGENPDLSYSYLLDYDVAIYGSLCNISKAIGGLTLTCGALLLFYLVILLVAAFVAANKGHPNVWTSTVRDTRFLHPVEGKDYGYGMKEVDDETMV